VAQPPTELSHPAPRSLRGVRGARRELVKIYTEAKAGVLEQKLAGRLTYILNSIASIDNAALFEDRLAEIERKLGIGSSRPSPNGHDREARL
jgi:hypothetical protein